MKKKIRHLLFLMTVFCFAGSVQAISWTSLDFPGARQTYITGIDELKVSCTVLNNRTLLTGMSSN